MGLQELWFVIIAALFLGFLVLEGFDFGVGMLMVPLGDTENRRRAVLNTIGPVWDANEVWLITAGAAMFAAFPNWYATLFSARERRSACQGYPCSIWRASQDSSAASCSRNATRLRRRYRSFISPRTI